MRYIYRDIDRLYIDYVYVYIYKCIYMYIYIYVYILGRRLNYIMQYTDMYTYHGGIAR